ncbi:pectate lyase family protein [Allostreptomyces psammosilenae]|uniref:Pectate lyase n=1 Tax=Allostreptomyces psammosilenae TaxID=1892865 RepID=A0A852ZLD3_9ACTN|nr:pectate lyase [Allostreptomyces psammosilenae]NYI03196.1 pectate lyase [Allostreptomyces psammosilenae]
MRTTTRALVSAACCLTVLGALAPAAAAGGRHQAVPAGYERLARQPLADGDGWASADGGTTGGSAATPEQVFVVDDRAELVAALGGDNASNGANDTPKIIYLRGTIDANTDDAGNPLSCADYATDGYSLEAYLAAYDPAVWGRDSEPSGPLEEARLASQRRQAERVQIRVGSNTTIIGLGDDARLLGGNLLLRGVDNVIIRNVTFEDAADCFPQWDPTDGSTGNWNSEYDTVTVHSSTHVWVDHSTFTDGRNPDSELPHYYGRIWQQHDGLLDITHGSDLVTLSWNRFADHGKTHLIGSTNSPTYDVGKLRVTLHHNSYANVEERAPRVRYGQVDVYNNLYTVGAEAAYAYGIGVGVRSQIVAERNFFVLEGERGAADVLYNWGGTAISESGNIVDGRPVSLRSAFNAANPDLALGDDAGWTPTLRTHVHPAWAVPALVGFGAGAGRL